MDNMEVIKIMPPVPGTCRECATCHEPGMPHDRDSLYYQFRFFCKHGRFPTWMDAMAHCTGTIRARAAVALAKHDIEASTKGGDDGQGVD